MDMDDEEALVTQAKSDPGALGELYDHYYPKIFGFFMRQCSFRIEIAQDLTSETFLKMVKYIGSFTYKHENSFAAWLFTIAHNNLKTYYKNANRFVFSPPEELEFLFSAETGDSEIGEIEAEYTRNEEFTQLSKVIATLDEKYQLIIELRFFQELSYQEIAAITGIKETTLKGHLHRALQKIKAKSATLQG